MAETLYQKRTKVRRMSDIERLAQQYSKNIASMTGEYEKSYADYQKMVAERMAPYEAEVQRYQTQLMPNYESQVSAYRQRLTDYQTKLADIQKRPYDYISPAPHSTVTESYGDDWRRGFSAWFPQFKKQLKPIDLINMGYEVTQDPKHGYFGEIRKRRTLEKFTEAAPSAPSVPQKPEIAAFDQSKFQASREETQKTFQREVSERKAARLGAVSRRATRPMLQET
jgi:hypothetical protein